MSRAWAFSPSFTSLSSRVSYTSLATRQPLAARSSSTRPRTLALTTSYYCHRPLSLFSRFRNKASTESTSSSSSSAATDNQAKMAHQKTDEEWRAILTPQQFRILREKGTEFAYTGEYTENKATGVYNCAGCNTPLYTSTTKFNACGWCSFYDAIPGAVGRHPDPDGHRIEIVCNACGGHLGHVFKGEGFKTPTDERHCVNSISLHFKAGDSA